MTRVGVFSLLAAVVAGHDDLPINPMLGVPGFPDCVQPVEALRDGNNVEQAASSLVCAQREKDFATQISVACVGDSITAGVHSSNGSMTYPAQLQKMLGDGYKVTNLGACGSTMLKAGDSPFWQRPQYKALTAGKWDIVVIMLGTNDAKDKGSGGPANWPHDCTGADKLKCPFAQDYKSMIDLVNTLGTSSAGPKVYVMIPPPLMAPRAYGMNQTVINEVFPVLVPAIAAENKLRGAIDIFNTFGGNDQKDFPAGGCTLKNTDKAKCEYYCSATQSWTCDQCHPDDVGYEAMASLVKYVIA